VPHTQGAGGAPLLEDCAARFVCERHAMHDGGDHWIMLGKVVALDDFGRAPLLYHQGSYAMALPHGLQQKKKTAPADRQCKSGWMAISTTC
jgi:flavin reductase (DIM6/NTAB) family NADH-FMN oxidoreductase RutF